MQARGWAVELCAGVDDDGYSANTATYLFTVNITLTEAGLAAAPGYGLAPVALLFQYLRLLTHTGETWPYLTGLGTDTAVKHVFCMRGVVQVKAHKD